MGPRREVLRWMDSDSPIVQCCSGVLAALNFDHEQREEQEEHGHAEANAVHSLVANQHIAVHMTLHTGNRRAHPSFTETWNLQRHTEHKPWHSSKKQENHLIWELASNAEQCPTCTKRAGSWCGWLFLASRKIIIKQLFYTFHTEFYNVTSIMQWIVRN